MQWKKEGGGEISEALVDDDADFDTVEASYEFLVSGEDSYTYLTINVGQTEDGWKVIWYGFEK